MRPRAQPKTSIKIRPIFNLAWPHGRGGRTAPSTLGYLCLPNRDGVVLNLSLLPQHAQL
uniref:Uncharacterized protein n=1 Tax=Anguilla anguilla TaxID=7936 RepID=A0A0E9P7S8_ANGAN